MKRYLIERDIPKVGILTHAQLKESRLTARSPEVPTVIGPMTAFD
ncbi:MAG TPA: hypothetical protein VF852_10505 [Pseudolabrys sp.]|jgi:hypothetical protein